MDTQKSLFKKFFTAGGKKVSLSAASRSPSGFNPPKFQFSKKKFGMINGSKVEPEKSFIGISEIESVEIESNCSGPIELGAEPSLMISDTAENVQGSKHAKSPIITSTTNPINSTSAASIYANIQEKHQQKYNLSNQLHELTNRIEMIDMTLKQKLDRFDLLIFGLDEKIGEMKAFNCDLSL